MGFLKDNFVSIYDAYHLNGKYNTLSKFHLDNYNKFANVDISTIINSYNPIIIDEVQNNKKLRATLNLENVFLNPPHCINYAGIKTPLYPNECRLTGKNYMCHVSSNYKLTISERLVNGNENVLVQLDSKSKDPLTICKVPVMVKSELCSLYGLNSEQLKAINEDEDELGGYFVISGNEYAIIPQENKAENFIFKNITEKDKRKTYSVWIQSKPLNQYTYPYYTMVNIEQKFGIPSIKIAVSISKKNGTYIPMKVLFMALGLISDEDIFNIIVEDEDDNVKDLIKAELRAPIYLKTKSEKKLMNIVTRNDALMYIVELYKASNKYYIYDTKNDDDVVKNLIYDLNARQLLPHIGGETELTKKIIFLGMMVKDAARLYLEYDGEVDRDNYGNKRILGSGVLLGQLFKYSMDMLISEVKKKIKKELSEYDKDKDYSMIVINSFREKKINMAKNINTGKWPAGFSKKEKEGISQLREVKSKMDIISYLTKIVTPVPDTNLAGIEMRSLHGSTYGFICPADTPDGANVGIVKNMAIMTMITENMDHTFIEKIVSKYKGVFDVEAVLPNEFGKYTKIFINGILKYVILIEDSKQFHKYLIASRRQGIIYRHCSIVVNYEDRIIKILTDGGRPIRPVLIVDNKIVDNKYVNELRLKQIHIDGLKNGELTYDDLIKLELLEYLDIHESQYNTIIAVDEESLANPYINYTHCEIDESVALSINTLTTASADKNQGPRISFEDTMRKQAIGLNVTNYRYRMDKSMMVLPFTQRPLVTTIAARYSGLDKRPYGTNIRVAFIPAEGYNLDDAIVVNKDSMVSNDIMTVLNYKTYEDVLLGNDEAFLKPNEKLCFEFNKNDNYSAIKPDGLPIIGSEIVKGDIIVGHVQYFTKTERDKNKKNYEYSNRSMRYDGNVPAVIDGFSITENENGEQIIKVTLRLTRRLKYGDKLASTAAQKGIVSMMVPSEELAYDEDGNVPDLCFNSHGIITRMTCSHLFEPLMGLIALLSGKRIDATPFCRMTLDDILEMGKKYGLYEFGERTMYDGKTGEKLKNKIYYGIIYYQRLKHMVDDKFFARGTGELVMKTRQPIQGKSHGGGLRVGNMEIAALISHGASTITKEFTFDKSDKSEEFISGENGMFCTGNLATNIYEDKTNYESANIHRVHIPWTTKMLKEYVLSMGLSMDYEVALNEL